MNEQTKKPGGTQNPQQNPGQKDRNLEQGQTEKRREQGMQDDEELDTNLQDLDSEER